MVKPTPPDTPTVAKPLPATVAAAHPPSAGLEEWRAGQVVLDDFVVRGELGRGGLGVVYKLENHNRAGIFFAVKRVKVAGERERANFIDELKTWTDLPDHLNLCACRFFRTMGDEIVIFAEFVAGGSLLDWIRDGRLRSIDQVLDVAIQFAWGLHAAHEWGLVHQDVKPANVLMTEDGVAKVADFGLARSKALLEEAAFGLADPGAAMMEIADASGQSLMVSCRGMTPAYCSPEQAFGRPLSRKTDVWSYGVSLLHLFSGRPFWGIGSSAASALEVHLSRGSAASNLNLNLPPMPPPVSDVLRRCLRPNPDDRWPNLLEAAEALARAYRELTGADYPRPTPAFIRASDHARLDHDRRTLTGKKYADPIQYLEQALAAAGRDPAEAKKLVPAPGLSIKAKTIADIAAFDEARRIFESLIDSGRRDLEERLAQLCLDKAEAHRVVDDYPGAVALYDKAIELRDRLVNREGRKELANDLAMAYVNKAISFNNRGDNLGAVALYDRALEIRERLVNREGRTELANDLAMAYMNKANALDDMGDHLGAGALYDRALEIRERLVNREGRKELASSLAMAYMNKALGVLALGDHHGAVALYDRSIEIYERLVNREGRKELANELAKTYMNKTESVRALRDHSGAEILCNKTVEIYKRLVEQEGRKELERYLAWAYKLKAEAVWDRGLKARALELCELALSILERVVKEANLAEAKRDLEQTRKLKEEILAGDNRGPSCPN